jgi:DNA repair exonuclease SbcCD nuclease subunit
MKRKKPPDYILTSDWHIRLDKPVCRTDDFLTAQSIKIKFILSLARNCNCPILIAGDVGHKPLWGDRLLNYFIDILNDFHDVDIYVVAGQHDLPNHRLDKWEEGGLGVLSKNGYIKILTEKFKTIQPFSYGEKIEDTDSEIVLVHHMIIKSQKDKLWHDQNAHSAKWHLRKLPSAKLVVSGDNHQSFAVEYEGRWLVNAGSLMRMSANQIDHKPSVYLWYAEDNSIERVYLPIADDVISREHIDVANERNERIESFVNRLKETEELGLSFESNMKEFFKTNKTRRKVMEKVWESME